MYDYVELRLNKSRIETQAKELAHSMRWLARDLEREAGRLEGFEVDSEQARQSLSAVPVNSLGVVQGQGGSIDNAIGRLEGLVEQYRAMQRMNERIAEQQDTCLCGQFPQSEYGEYCPSCHPTQGSLNS